MTNSLLAGSLFQMSITGMVFEENHLRFLNIEEIDKNKHFRAIKTFLKNQKSFSVLLMLKICFLIKKQRKLLFLANFKASVLIDRVFTDED